VATREDLSQVAASTPFDDSNVTYVADDVQEALEQQNSEVNTSASPGFSFGRRGNTPTNTWLLNEGVPSNKAGRWVYISGASVERVFVSNVKVTSYEIEVFHHSGAGTSMTSVGSVSVVSDYGGAFDVSWAVPTNKQLAIRVKSGSPKNIVCGLELAGTN